MAATAAVSTGTGSVRASLTPAAVARLVSVEGKCLSLLTGAGVSTESGLPDYRGEKGLYRASTKSGSSSNSSSNNNNNSNSSSSSFAAKDATKHVIQHADFMRSEELRKRYWARSVAGFERFQAARPNRTHAAVEKLREAGVVRAVVTQNVDRLHALAGTSDVVELHGRGDLVHCTRCGWEISRAEYQSRLRETNKEHARVLREAVESGAKARPDFDAAVPEERLTPEALATFHLPTCDKCGHAVIKPSFVFFGGSVPPAVSEAAARALASAPVLLVVGTTCTTYSAYRPVSLAREKGVDVGVVNRGETRVDPLANLGFFSHDSCGAFFEELLGELRL